MEAPAGVPLRPAGAGLLCVLALAAACEPGPGGNGGARSEARLPVVSWEHADRHVGREVIVVGTVVAAKNTGRACFLNFHRNWRRYFTAVIFARSFARFPAPPEEMYAGRAVRVRGTVREYRGKPEIVVENPKQIEIVAAPGAAPAPR